MVFKTSSKLQIIVQIYWKVTFSNVSVNNIIRFLHQISRIFVKLCVVKMVTFIDESPCGYFSIFIRIVFFGFISDILPIKESINSNGKNLTVIANSHHIRLFLNYVHYQSIYQYLISIALARYAYARGPKFESRITLDFSYLLHVSYVEPDVYLVTQEIFILIGEPR